MNGKKKTAPIKRPELFLNKPTNFLPAMAERSAILIAFIRDN
jgi:hypothetical protein